MPASNAMNEALLRLIFLNSIPAGNPFTSFGSAGTTLTASGTAGTLELALHTNTPGAAGSQSTNEVSYTGYARDSIARSGSGWTITTPNVIKNAGTVDWGQRSNTGATVTATHFSIGQDNTGAGDFYWSAPLGLETSLPFTVDASVSTVNITAPDHGYTDNDQVAFIAVLGDALPSGVTEGTVYYVVNATTDDFEVEASIGGGAITLGNGSGRVQMMVAKPITYLDTPQAAANALVLELD